MRLQSPEPASHRHGVVFYSDDDLFLSDAILDFCLRALAARDPLLLIATRSHLDTLAIRLAEHGFDWDVACRTGAASEHDARDLLRQFCVGGHPDPARFGAVMGELLAPWAEVGPERTVRAFGEMVDLLCRRGQLEDAARLEEMWNHLARTHRFTLLCAYSMGNLYREVHGTAYRRICDAHDHVLPWAAPGTGTGAAQSFT